FEYGLTSDYGSTTPLEALGSGNGAVAVGSAVTGLRCNTPYHFRAVAASSEGTANGSDAAFTTSACPTTELLPPENLSASTVGSTVTLTWSAASSGAPASGYVIEAGTAPGASNGGVVSTGTTVLSFVVTNVPAGQYYARIRAVNDAGTGDP